MLITTIHQAKGLEWDVVMVGSLNDAGRENDRIGQMLAEFLGGPGLEPAERIASFDLARRHYVGFTRARHMLALTCSGQPQPRYRSIWERASCWPGVDRAALARQRFAITDVDASELIVQISHLNQLVVAVGLRRGLAR